ncbi:latent-transforming growth factor beta-binding protein 4-like isoform X2 [Stylophora pistillata]|uniref:latent-transforming growth factor beta-binding protein 4-like isoform X2 n=1 Tax=Stylophora pistillata TaxID=50429 RepID=UPI000C055A26|nr:latent-transforming growth factor beta-binding protein 4-like isoform X2 [Stylophora pistillata]
MRRKHFFVILLFLSSLYVALSARIPLCGWELGVRRRSSNMIPDSQMSSSSEDPNYPAANGRLKDKGWSPDEHNAEDKTPYLQIDLGGLYLVCGFKIQGCSGMRPRPAWVIRYRAQVSPEKDFWDDWNYIRPEFHGGISASALIYSNAKERKVGQYVRIFPVSFMAKICMKIEIYGHPYIAGNRPVFVFMPMHGGFLGKMYYTRTQVKKVEGTLVTLKDGKEYNLEQDFAQIVPLYKPLVEELRVNACVIVLDGYQYKSGRVHGKKYGHYLIEILDEDRPRMFKVNQIHPVFNAWCGKIDFYSSQSRIRQDGMCGGMIVRVDSKIVFKPSGQSILIRISYQMKDRKRIDFMSGEAVDPGKVVLGEIVLYEDMQGCIAKGKVTSYMKPQNLFIIDGKRIRTSKVRSLRFFDDDCKSGEWHCDHSRFPFRGNRRKCPKQMTYNLKRCADEDECKTGFASCAPDAVCKNSPGFYKCSCPTGFRSRNPRKETCRDIDECKEGPCHKDAHCINTPGVFYCHCKKGFEGDGKKRCDYRDECKVAANKQKCEQHKHAVCVSFPGEFKCQCKEGYYGADINSCKLADECKLGIHKCHKWAKCVNTEKSYDCHCKDGFEGNGKECRDIDECSNWRENDCLHSDTVVCKNTNGSYECVCAEGYTGDGKQCKNINECRTGSHKCVKYAECIDKLKLYDCKCRVGFHGDGRKECTPSSECMRNIPDCDLPRATCEETSKGKFKCSCKPGYKGDGKKCADIDECKNDICDKNAECKNLPGHYTCTCKKGYRGNGLSCSDIDECETGWACGENAECVNNDGSFWCNCNKGYRGNPPSEKCQDIDECKVVDCGYGLNCNNTVGAYVCSCAKGFRPTEAKPGECHDINECDTEYPCGMYNYLECVNQPGNYTCHCKKGYRFNKKHKECQDINECRQRAKCVENSVCLNAEGSYACVCANGYSGDGKYFCEGKL